METTTLRLDLPYRHRKQDQVAMASNLGFDDNGDGSGLRDISDFLIRTAINSSEKYRQGMPRTDSRIWATILSKLEDRAATLTISAVEFAWLHELVDNFNYLPVLSPWRWILLEEFERAKNAVRDVPPLTVVEISKA